MKAALRNGGILCSQGNFIFHHSFVFKVGATCVGNFSVSADLNRNCNLVTKLHIYIYIPILHPLFKPTKKASHYLWILSNPVELLYSNLYSLSLTTSLLLVI